MKTTKNLMLFKLKLFVGNVQFYNKDSVLRTTADEIAYICSRTRFLFPNFGISIDMDIFKLQTEQISLFECL